MNNLAPKRLLPSLIISFALLIANINVLCASDIYQCATSKDVYDALDTVKPGDTIMLQGGKVYEIDKSFKLHANGSDKNRITLTSEDSTGQGRYAVISTVGQKAASFVTVRNNILYCYEKSYNKEVVKLVGFANIIKDNKFIGSNKNLTRYIQILTKKTDDPVRVGVDYLDQKNIPAPTGRDNTVVNNVFYTNDPKILVVEIDVAPIDRSSVIVENNKIEPFDDTLSAKNSLQHLFPTQK